MGSCFSNKINEYFLFDHKKNSYEENLFIVKEFISKNKRFPENKWWKPSEKNMSIWINTYFVCNEIPKISYYSF